MFNCSSPGRGAAVGAAALVFCAFVPMVYGEIPPGAVYCTPLVSQLPPQACPVGSIPLSPFTTTTWVPDGELCEFIAFPSDPQEYFITDSIQGDDFGAIKADAELTRGVLVTRDNFPNQGSVVAGPTGYFDAPCIIANRPNPTGFNIGRMFLSFNPRAYGGQGAYFIGVDLSAPAVLDQKFGTQPIAFDVDGNGDRCTFSEPTAGEASEAPIKVEDLYTLVVDTNNDTIPDVRIRIGEQPGTVPPFGSFAINPGGMLQTIPDSDGILRTIQRFIRFEDLTGTLPGTPLTQAIQFLDSNNDGTISHLDVGIDSDIELVIRNVGLLPNNQDVACAVFTFLADSFDDVFCGGAEEKVALSAQFPVPDIEVIKEARCVGEPETDFRHAVEVVPGSTVEFRISIQNWGNRDLDVDITDALSAVAPATTDLIEGSCQIVGTNPIGVKPDFCSRFEAALNAPGLFPLEVGTLRPIWALTTTTLDNNCAIGPGERIVFTFRVRIGPDAGNSAFCDAAVDVSNLVSVAGTLSLVFDPILPPSPAGQTDTADGEEEDCADAACCMSIPPCGATEICQSSICIGVSCSPDPPVCIPNDGVGDVVDDLLLTVFDDGGVADTLRELAPGRSDDNRVDIEINCRSITLAKEVREVTINPNAPFTTGDISLDLPSAPAEIEYRYTIVNGGEVDEQTTLTDSTICTDLAGIAGVTLISCPLCVPPTPGVLTQVVAAGATLQTTCRVRFATQAALVAFTGSDDPPQPVCDGTPPPVPVLCYRNCASVTAEATNLDRPVGGICPNGAIEDDSFATVCHFPCDIQVTKQVRCLDNCDEKNVIGLSKDALMTTRDSCVEYVVTVANLSPVIPVCRLRITDTLSNQPSCIVFDGPPHFAVDGVDCGAVPPGFNVTGTPFEWNPVTHCGGRAALEPGETLTIRFNATIPENAPLSCGPMSNAVDVDAASDCRQPQQPGFTCSDDDSASVDLLEPSLTCVSKEWAFQWDSDADCQPEEPFSAFANSIDLRDKVFPVQLRLKVKASNTGQIPLEVMVDDAQLMCVCATPGVTCAPTCEIGDSKILSAGEMADWLCDIRVDTAEAMRDIDTCDGTTTPFVYNNHATVSGRLVRDDTNICVPEDFNIPGTEAGNACRATIQVPEACELTVTKQVKCADDPDASYATSVDALAGSRLTYRIQVRNDDPRVKIPRLCIDDTLTCPDWLVAGSVTADIAGANVLTCMAGFEASLDSGDRVCYTFAACRAANPWIAPGETLTLKFDVKVPADFDVVGTDPDCENDVTVQGYSEVCVPTPLVDAVCDTSTSHAEFDVLIPEMNCDKQVGADLDNDGDLEVPLTHDLSLPCDTVLPFTLEYKFTVTNKGETPLTSVQICDPELVADARAAGLIVGPCALCNDANCDGTGDTCANLPALPAGQMAMATCRIRVPSRAAWELFAGRDTDGNANRYANSSSALANVNTAAICDFQADTRVTSDVCSATAFLAPLCQLEVTKQARCLQNCAGGNAIGENKDVLPAAPGSCVEFKVNITNTSSTLPICRLRISDTLSNQPTHITFSDTVRFTVGATNCPVPVGFNVSGTPFDWDPSTCGLPSFGPGQVLMITFNATIPVGADPAISPTNTIIVSGAPTCPTTPNFCCQASADAQVDIQRPRLTCTSKQWAFQWDSDGDCEPEEPFSAFSSNINLSDKVFPVLLRLKVTASNTGEVPLDVTASDPTLACVCATPGVLCSVANCEMGTTKLIAAGGSADWTCDIAVETADAMRDVAACDGSANLTYVDTVTVTGRLVRSTTNICVPENRVINGDAPCMATINVPAPCEFTIDKLVKCADDPDLAYDSELEVIPGAVERFRIRVTNQSPTTKIPRLCIRDLLSCCTWFVAGSVRATIGATDVTACISPEFDAALCDGDPECYTFAECRPAAPWLAPAETLTIIFDVRVPPVFGNDKPTECTNDLQVDGYEQVCPPMTIPDVACDTANTDTNPADFSVREPELACAKQVRADQGADGSFESGFDDVLILPCDAVFPLVLEYKWTVTNTGNADLIGIEICDPQLRPDAVAAGLTIVSCDIPATPQGCAALPPLPEGNSGMATCRIRVPSRMAWATFAGSDTDADADCYTNESQSEGSVDADDLCTFGAEPDFGSEPCSATVCLAPECAISVAKQARCLNNCQERTPVGNLRDDLPVVPGSCMQFEFSVTNDSLTDPLCRLRICDTLAGGAANIVYSGNARFRVGTTDCPVPAGFRVDGTCFEWDPTTCGLVDLGAGQTLTVTFDAQIPLGANPAVSPVNTVVVGGAPTCKNGRAQFCCQDTADAVVDIQQSALRCDGKQWAFQWDSDGDCEPEAPFGAFSDEIDLTDKVFPVLLRLRVDATNTGQVPVSAVAEDPTLLTCASTTPGVMLVNPASCELGLSKNIAVGGSASWTCDIRVEKAEAMRALAACDGTDDGIYTNKAIVSGLLKSGTSGVCVPNQGAVVADNQQCSATIRAPQACRFNLDKTVICTSGCTGSAVGLAAETMETVPGAFSRFTVTVTNSDPKVKIPRLCLTDVLSCADWICPGSVRASLSGTDVSGGLICRNDPAHSFQPDGQRCCITFPGRAAAPWIAPGESLTLTFDVRVPAGFNVAGVVPDCVNNIAVESFAEACAAEDKEGCATDNDTAAIDVQVPRLECNKTVAVDLGNDGSIDISAANSVTVSNPPFPVRLIYNFTARNTGDSPLTNVSMCDDGLVAHARAAGITVTGCDVCNDPACDGIGDTCKLLGPLAAGATRLAVCQLIVADQDQWENFADRDSPDNRGDCYVNEAQATGTLSGRCVPPGFPTTVSSAPCEATVCMNIVHRCPTTKAVFDIWNQNERRFSGTERCIVSWDQTLLSRYTPSNIGNHFVRSTLQTDRGKARIEGVASGNVCGNTSIDAPMLGVAARILNFGRDGVELAGRTLVGSGDEAGTIFYDPVPGAPVRESFARGKNPEAGFQLPPAYGGYRAEPRSLNRAGASQKGSLLVFPKVEVKWNAAGEVIQDTILSLSNDFPENVLVQMYFVNGDQPTDAELDGDVVLERAHLGCNWVDNLLPITANQPVYWSVLTGDPQDLSPFTILDPGDPPGRPDPDDRNNGGRVLRGYVLAWAVNSDSQEIRWNHLIGEAIIINYQDTSAWDYLPWSLQALAGASNGSLLDAPSGRLDLNGIEYDSLPSALLLDFAASGSTIAGPEGITVSLDTDLTLWVATKDLRNP